MADLFEQANQAQQDVVNTMQGGSKLTDMLRQAVSERFKDSPIYGMREQAAAQMLNYPSEKRAQLAQMGQSGDVILSPSQQNAIMSAGRTARLTPLMTLNDMLNFRTGTAEQAINAGIEAYKTDLGVKQQIAKDLYQKAQDQWQRDLAEKEYNLSAAKAEKELGPSVFEQLLSQYSNRGATDDKVSYLPGYEPKGSRQGIIPDEILNMAVLSGEISPSAAKYYSDKTQDTVNDYAGLKEASSRLVKQKNPILFNQTKNTIASFLGKLMQTGIITDKDYDRYFKLLPNYITTLISPKSAQAQVDNFFDNISIITEKKSTNLQPNSQYELIEY